MKTYSTAIRIVSAIASGLFMTVAFPKFNLSWMAWVAIVPLLVVIKECSAGQSFRLGFIGGLTHYLTLLHWLVYTMQAYGKLPAYLAVPVLVLLAAYLALYWGIFALIVSRLTLQPMICFFAVPVLWTALEYIRTHLLSGFPWALVGYSQGDWFHLIQIVDIFGVYGVSFLVLLGNAAIYSFWLFKGTGLKKRKVWSPTLSLAVAICLLAAGLGYGHWQVSRISRKMGAADHKKIALVQGNIDQDVKWDPAFQEDTIDKYLELSLSTKSEHPDLVIWPETATPFYFMYEKAMTYKVLKGIRASESDFLTGSPSFERTGESIVYFNSAYLIDSDGSVKGKYDKVHLVPYGEYVPFKEWFPFLGKMVAHVGDFRPGKLGNTLIWEDTFLGVQICFEIIFPKLSQTLVKNGAAILINITNDAWFGNTGAPYQHFSKAVFRAVENRRPLVRAANTGISGIVDPTGKIITRTPLFTEATRIHRVPILEEKSVYTRFGDVFSQICAVASGLLAMLIMIKPSIFKP
jgi:apolipoprotein N-acyltransferase